MKVKYISASFAIALIMPFAAAALTADDIQAQIASLLAQISQLQQQIQNRQQPPQTSTPPSSATVYSQPVTATCPVLLRTLSRGHRGADVLALQKYLIAEGFLTANSATAFYGPATESAVQIWQARRGIVADGSAATTGWGVAGAKTRAAITRLCASGSGNTFSDSRPGTLSCPIAPPPTSICSAGWQAITDAYGCTTSYKCSTPLPQIDATSTVVAPCPQYQQILCTSGYHAESSSVVNGCRTAPRCVPDQSRTGAPVIASIDGPATLSVGERGTWTVRASVPNSPSASIRYSVNWGDEILGSIGNQLSATAYSAAIQTSGTFTHAYSGAGQYQPLFFVSNDSGSANVSASVQVGDTPRICPVDLRAACPKGYHYEVGDPPYTESTPGCRISNLKCVPDSNGTSFIALPTLGNAPLTVTFASNVTLPGPYLADAGAYKIVFGDGQEQKLSCSDGRLDSKQDFSQAYPTLILPTQSCRPAAVTHTYTAAGTYTASLVHYGGYTAPDFPNSITVGTATITVTGGTISSNFSASPTSGTAPLAVTFASSYGDATDYRPSHIDGVDTFIDFGDGSEKQWVQCSGGPYGGSNGRCTSSVHITHTYAREGTYVAKIMRIGGFPMIGSSPSVPPPAIATATITVSGTTNPCTSDSSVGTCTQSNVGSANLANVLTALESLLKSFLEKIGR